MADDDFEVQTTDSGASLFYPMQCSALRKNGHVLIKGRPCKIVDMSTSKTGKHGHAKVHLVALDVFTGKKYEDICPSTHNMDVPNIKRTEYELVEVTDEGFVSLMTDAGTIKEDLKLPDDAELKKKLKEGDGLMVTVLKCMGEEMIISAKNSTAADP